MHLKGPPIGLGGERFPARRLFGILMGFSWENCPQNRPLHRCLCFRSAVLRVRECVRYNPVWRNLKYTSNFCFDVSLRTLEVEHFFFSPQNILPLLLHNKKHRNGYIYYVKFLRLNFMTVINKKTYWLKWGVISTWGIMEQLVWALREVTMMPITTGFHHQSCIVLSHSMAEAETSHLFRRYESDRPNGFYRWQSSLKSLLFSFNPFCILYLYLTLSLAFSHSTISSAPVWVSEVSAEF